MVRTGDELAEQMAKLLRDRIALQGMGDAAKQVVLENQGAVRRSLDLIGEVLRDSGPGEAGRDRVRPSAEKVSLPH
jgi:hypothetical protein